MASHLNKHVLLSLTPNVRNVAPHCCADLDGNQRAPTVLDLHRFTSRLAKRMAKTYRVLTPELNTAPFLWRIVRWMGGTRKFIYMQVLDLMKLFTQQPCME